MKNLLSKLVTLPANDRIFGLDFLRAMAILGVLVAHGSLFFTSQFNIQLFITFDFAGVFGVELFFVLSGFLIGSILLKLEKDFHHSKVLAHFWTRRWFRTLPNYWLFLFLYILANLIIKSPLPNIIPFLSFTQNFLAPHPLFFDQAWSLAIEEWFYLLFPLLLFIINKLTKSFNISFLISAMIFIILPTFLRSQWALNDLQSWEEYFRKITLLRLDAVMYGVFAAWIKQNRPTIWRNQRFLLAAIGFILQACTWVFIFSVNFDKSIFAKIFFFTITSISFTCLIPLFDQWNSQTNNFTTITIRLIALWSYSLYLCNFLLVQVITNIAEYFHITSSAANYVLYIFYILISLVLSSLIYTFLEKPAMDLRELFFKKA